jgi:hypothetical protein
MDADRAFYPRITDPRSPQKDGSMTLLRSLLVVVATAAVAACGSSPSLPDTDAALDGTLTEFLLGPQYLGAPTSVLVDENLPDPEDQTIVHVETRTRVYLVGRGGKLVPADRDDLAVGDRLQVWTTGAETRSYPAQVTATRVHIIRVEQ